MSEPMLPLPRYAGITVLTESQAAAWRAFGEANHCDVSFMPTGWQWVILEPRDGGGPFPLPPPPAPVPEPPPPTPAPRQWADLPAGAEIVDVSENNRTPDWARVKAFGIVAAYVRCGAVFAEDGQFLYNWFATRKLAIPRGPYFYWRWDEDQELQLERCWRSTLGDGELPLAVDVELRRDEPDPPASERPAITEKLRNFLLGIEARFGYRPIIYTSPRYWHAMTTRPAWAGEYKLWLADWSGPPDYPDGWTWAVLRQYAVGAAGSVPGIVTAIDRDRWMGWTPPPAPVKHTFAGMTNQQVLNLFWRVFASWSQLTRAIPNWGQSMAANQTVRAALYSGPAVEEMELTDMEKQALIDGLV